MSLSSSFIKRHPTYYKDKDEYISKCIKTNKIEVINDKFKLHKKINDYHQVLSFMDNNNIKYYVIQTDNLGSNNLCFTVPHECIAFRSDENGISLDDDNLEINYNGNDIVPLYYGTVFDLMTKCLINKN